MTVRIVSNAVNALILAQMTGKATGATDVELRSRDWRLEGHKHDVQLE
ncbi:hypothetical protein BANRA_05188 [Escherichia coli]|nr:hypothetical protein BANRA_05188 [Escherichia coli]